VVSKSVTVTRSTTPTDQRPTAALTVSPATGVVPFTTTADASGSTDDIGIASYRFDWGDGSPATTGSSATAQHQYTGAGSYTVTMTVTDTTGQSASQTRSVTGTNPGSTLKPTTVVVTFDDGVADQVTGLNAMKSAGLPATIYVNSAELGTSGYMSKSNLDTYAAAGMEIAGHTLHHPHLLSLSATDARREICNDRAALTGMGYKVTSFAYPYGEGSTNASVRQYVQDCGYNDARGVSGILSPGYGCSGCPTAETIPPQDLWNIRQPQSVQQGTTLAQLQNYVTQAENDNGGLVPLLFHHICSGCDEYSMTPANFSAFVSWLAARPGTTVVRTMDQVIGGAVKPVVTVP
jgi:PKD repeat protein